MFIIKAVGLVWHAMTLWGIGNIFVSDVVIHVDDLVVPRSWRWRKGQPGLSKWEGKAERRKGVACSWSMECPADIYIHWSIAEEGLFFFFFFFFFFLFGVLGIVTLNW
jgi:hypothetical protein